MPELPEVETIVRRIRPRVVGREVVRVVHASNKMARSTVGSFRRGLAGRRFVAMDRHGKWMFLGLDDANTLVVHLGMTGRLSLADADDPSAPHTHLRLLLSIGRQELRFSDSRRFGELYLCNATERKTRFGPTHLGPDALAIRPRDLAHRLTHTRRSIKAALLDQRVVAGVGNIYADEILFAAAIAPMTPAWRAVQPSGAPLLKAVRDVLNAAIRHNGTTIRDYVTADGVPGQFQQRLAVYGRDKQPCRRCATAIELSRTIVSGRATYWCPRCQASLG